MSSPPTALRERFIELQGQLLRHYGVDARSRYVELRDPPIRVHLLDAGQGPPIVILHGGDGEGVNWAPLMAPLQQHAHLFAVDRPGFGLTDRFDYRTVNLRQHAAAFVGALLDALGLPRATVMGGSMGGFFALSAALAHPRRIERLILVGMPLGLASTAPLPLRLIGGIPGLSRLFMAGRPSLDNQRAQYRKMFSVDLSRVPDLYLETRAAGVSLPGAQDTWAILLRRIVGLRGIRPEVTLTRELPNLRQPTLIIWGEHDMQPPAVGEHASCLIPNARFVTLPGVGHFPFLEDPARCAELILGFLADTAAAAREPQAKPA